MTGTHAAGRELRGAKKQLILTAESPEVLEGRRKAVGDGDGTDQNRHQDECHLRGQEHKQ